MRRVGERRARADGFARATRAAAVPRHAAAIGGRRGVARSRPSVGPRHEERRAVRTRALWFRAAGGETKHTLYQTAAHPCELSAFLERGRASDTLHLVAPARRPASSPPIAVYRGWRLVPPGHRRSSSSSRFSLPLLSRVVRAAWTRLTRAVPHALLSKPAALHPDAHTHAHTHTHASSLFPLFVSHRGVSPRWQLRLARDGAGWRRWRAWSVVSMSRSCAAVELRLWCCLNAAPDHRRRIVGRVRRVAVSVAPVRLYTTALSVRNSASQKAPSTAAITTVTTRWCLRWI